MKKTKLILSSLAIASFLVGSAINLPPASSQTNEDDYQKQLYDNKELFEQLSGAAQSVLELKFGQVVAPASRPTPGGPTTDFLTAIEEDSNVLVNNPNEDLTARDTQSETTLVVFGPGGIDNTSCSAFNDSGSFVPPATASSKFTGFSQSSRPTPTGMQEILSWRAAAELAKFSFLPCNSREQGCAFSLPLITATHSLRQSRARRERPVFKTRNGLRLITSLVLVKETSTW